MKNINLNTNKVQRTTSSINSETHTNTHHNQTVKKQR